MTETCQPALGNIKKSQSLPRRTRARITCGSSYKRFVLKGAALARKEEKLGRFSVCCGCRGDSSAPPPLYGGRGGEFRLCDAVGEFLRRFSVEGCLIPGRLPEVSVRRKPETLNRSSPSDGPGTSEQLSLRATSLLFIPRNQE